MSVPVGDDGFFFCLAALCNYNFYGGNIMSTRTLTDLRNKFDGHIYLRFHSHSEYDDFLTRAEAEGFRFGEHLPTEHLGEPWDIVSLLDGKKLAFCATVSHMAYQAGGDNVRRADYFKYISGEDDYLF